MNTSFAPSKRCNSLSALYELPIINKISGLPENSKAPERNSTRCGNFINETAFGFRSKELPNRKVICDQQVHPVLRNKARRFSETFGSRKKNRGLRKVLPNKELTSGDSILVPSVNEHVGSLPKNFSTLSKSIDNDDHLQKGPDMSPFGGFISPFGEPSPTTIAHNKKSYQVSSLPNDFFALKSVTSTYRQVDTFLESVQSINNDPNTIIGWVQNNIKYVSNPQILREISNVLISDNAEIRKQLCGADFTSEDVNGLFVKEIYLFAFEDQMMIIKRIPKASQLSPNHRGFYVSLMYAYGTQGRSTEVSEFRPLLNLLMLKQMGKAISSAVDSDVLKCLLLPKIGVILPTEAESSVKKSAFYQVMPYVNTEISIQDQILPEDGDKISKLVINICDAACLANVLLQGDCCGQNVCFTKDAQGDLLDVRFFDIDVIDPGDEEDITGVYDCTNPRAFDAANSEFHRVNGLGLCYDVRSALPIMVSKQMSNVLLYALPTLRQIVVAYASFVEGQALEVPFMLREGGLIDRYKDRVMVLSEDGKLYKNRQSEEYIEYDATVALFILFKLHCANDRRSLFLSLSFKNLEERYKDFVSPAREKELMTFFEGFIEK